MQTSTADLAQVYSSKSDEELCSLHERGTLTQLAYDVLESELRRRGLTVPKRQTAEEQGLEASKRHERTTLVGHWQGKASLASAYWLVGKLGFTGFYGLALLIREFAPSLTPLAGLAMLAFLIFAWVAIWRCWKNTSLPVLGYLARFEVVIFVAIALVVTARLISEALEPRSIIE